MELLIGAAIGGVLLALSLFMLTWKIVSRAVDNALDWLIHNFGNERARGEIEQRRRHRDIEP